LVFLLSGPWIYYTLNYEIPQSNFSQSITNNLKYFEV
jgi:hypothetical protein